MRQEQVNQDARDGKLIQVASMAVREAVVERVSRLVDGKSFLMLDDFFRELEALRALLRQAQAPGRGYAYAVPADIAKPVLLELLLVPARQADLADDCPATSTAASKELAKAAQDAERIAHKLWQGKDSVPTLELLDKELAKCKHRELTERLLFSAQGTDATPTTAAGNLLPRLPAIPRHIACEARPKVSLIVKSVDEDQRVAWVVIEAADNPDAIALSGLFTRRVQMAFDDQVFPGLGKLLLLAQTTEVAIQAYVVVRRGLGANPAKQDLLSVSELLDEPATRETIAAGLVKMQAVKPQLDLELSPMPEASSQ